MSREIIKPNRDEDYYVEWESIVEAPTFAGTRAELLDYAAAEKWQSNIQNRIDRVDRKGASALWTERSWDDDFSIIFEQRGSVRRSQLRALVESLDEIGQATEATLALLEPFERPGSRGQESE